MKLLSGLSRSEFLETYWQKKPLLIRQGLINFQSPISKEELAGLACEPEVESRLIIENNNGLAWSVKNGPFDENDFKALPATNWSLLVQAVDHYRSDIANLLELYDFIPAWRVDDVMISYAPMHGSVGPHLDNYDVFLLQAKGRRHWYINESDYSDQDFIEGLDLRIIEQFNSQEEWILEPGDILYLPPGVAHHGIAMDECLTFSIGFRAPTDQELLQAYLDHTHNTEPAHFYSDPDLTVQAYAGEINKQQLNTIQQHMRSILDKESDFSSWFGQYITECHINLDDYHNDQLTLEDFIIDFKQSSKLIRHGFIRMAYFENDDSVQFFFAGSEFSLSKEYLNIVRYISSRRIIDYSEICELDDDTKTDMALKLLFDLYTENCFYFNANH